MDATSWVNASLAFVLILVTGYYAFQNKRMVDQLRIQNVPLLKLDLNSELDLNLENVGNLPAKDLNFEFYLTWNKERFLLGRYVGVDLNSKEMEFIELKERLFKILEKRKLAFSEKISPEQYYNDKDTGQEWSVPIPRMRWSISARELLLRLSIKIEFKSLSGALQSLSKKYIIKLYPARLTADEDHAFKERIKILIYPSMGRWRKEYKITRKPQDK